MKETVTRRKLELLESLRRAILTLEMPPGFDLDELELCKKYQLSRTPLREILQQLAGEGYVQLRKNRGARVCEMSYIMLRDFFLVAPIIYSTILQLASQHAKPQQIYALKESQIKFKAALLNGSVIERALYNNFFHEITGEMAHNVYLLPSFKRLLIDHARIGIRFYAKENSQIADTDVTLQKASQQHDAIIASIETGNVEEASDLAIAHWNLSRHQIEAFVMPAPLDVDNQIYKFSASGAK